MGSKATKAAASKTVKSEVKKAVFVPPVRKATFNVTKKNGKRVFTPVNKRAKAIAQIAGTTTLVAKQLKGAKTLRVQLADAATLKAITL